MKTPKVALVLAPHTDDGEFGCGGTIAKFIESGARVVYVAFSAAEESVPEGFPDNILRTEVISATKELGIARNDCIVLNYKVRCFPNFRQDILDDMIRLRREYNPDLVLLPSRADTHQDHEVIAREGFRAFKNTTMLAYEAPRNMFETHLSCFSVLTADHVRKKCLAISRYVSQSNRNYANERFVDGLAVTRGIQVNANYAEAFEVVRWLID